MPSFAAGKYLLVIQAIVSNLKLHLNHFIILIELYFYIYVLKILFHIFPWISFCTSVSLFPHQDYHYFPFKKDSMVAIFFNLDDSSPDNGGLCVYPGSHKHGPQEDVSDDPRYHFLDKVKYPIEKATPLHLKKGQVITIWDVLFFLLP